MLTVRKRFKELNIIPILIPLFASSFKRADALCAMETRGYNGGRRSDTFFAIWHGEKNDSLAIIKLTYNEYSALYIEKLTYCLKCF